MRIFVSWSGDRSRQIAAALKEWLPDVFQGVEIFMSQHDIEAGARWGNRLNSELEGSSFGIICLTPENLTAPWILFESGALSKAIKESRVVPYLYDLKPTDVAWPLAQFQATVADRTGTFNLIQSINLNRDQILSPEHLKKAFDKWWEDLNNHLQNISNFDGKSIPQRSSAELLEEVLQILRSPDTENERYVLQRLDQLDAKFNKWIFMSIDKEIPKSAYSKKNIIFQPSRIIERDEIASILTAFNKKKFPGLTAVHYDKPSDTLRVEGGQQLVPQDVIAFVKEYLTKYDIDLTWDAR